MTFKASPHVRSTMSQDSSSPLAPYHGTTIVSVRRGNQVAIGGDGQVTLGSIVVKSTARKVRKTRSRCSSASRPSSRSTRAIWCARRWT